MGRIAVCAEAVAIGMAAAAGDTDIDTIVTVDRHGHIVPPCGMYRELISDYSADCRVILVEDRVVSVRDCCRRSIQGALNRRLHIRLGCQYLTP